MVGPSSERTTSRLVAHSVNHSSGFNDTSCRGLVIHAYAHARLCDEYAPALVPARRSEHDVLGAVLVYGRKDGERRIADVWTIHITTAHQNLTNQYWLVRRDCHVVLRPGRTHFAGL